MSVKKHNIILRNKVQTCEHLCTKLCSKDLVLHYFIHIHPMFIIDFAWKDIINFYEELLRNY